MFFRCPKTVGFGRFKIKNRNRTETEPNTSRSVSRRNQPNGQPFEGFDVHTSLSYDMIERRHVFFLPYLRLLCQTVEVETTIIKQCCESKMKMARLTFRFLSKNVGRFPEFPCRYVTTSTVLSPAHSLWYLRSTIAVT